MNELPDGLLLVELLGRETLREGREWMAERERGEEERGREGGRGGEGGRGREGEREGNEGRGTEGERERGREGEGEGEGREGEMKRERERGEGVPLYTPV